MSRIIGRLACLWLIPALSAATLATAAEHDMRLVDAVAAQDRTVVRALLKQRVDVNVARADGTTALLYAAHWDDIETIDLLLLAGANPNAADDHGVTPLARACENASIRVVERLLEAGADANAAQASGLTPLMTAARTGNPQVVRSAPGARRERQRGHNGDKKQRVDVGGRRSTFGHCSRADRGAGGRPCLNGERIHATDDRRAQQRHRNSEGVNRGGGRVNDTGTDGIHVLPFSIVVGQADFALFLLDQGADPNGAMAGIRALHAAVTSVRPWLAEWSQKHGVAGRAKDLTRPQRRALVKALLARGADPNSRITNSAVFEPWLAYPRKGAFERYSCGTGDLRGATPLWLVAHAANGRAGIVYNGVDAPDPERWRL